MGREGRGLCLPNPPSPPHRAAAPAEACLGVARPPCAPPHPIAPLQSHPSPSRPSTSPPSPLPPHPATPLKAEVVEYAAGIGRDLMGEYLEQVSGGIDTYSIRQPLGVTAGICPFNFPGGWGGWGGVAKFRRRQRCASAAPRRRPPPCPHRCCCQRPPLPLPPAAMIPLWMFPLATAAGNTMVLKPSERDPGAAMMLAELALEAGAAGLRVTVGASGIGCAQLCGRTSRIGCGIVLDVHGRGMWTAL